jgi:shikimate dehydrogenase
MDRYVVIGNPVAHSLSPAIHARFARETGEAIAYDRLLADRDGFDRAARAFFEGGGCGANITLPFKVDAFRFAHDRSARAERAGAANFLMRRADGIYADNTDGAGLVNDLQANLGFELRGKRILLAGAGGAARGVVAPLLAASPGRLLIANRTVARARELAQAFAALGPVEACALDAVGGDAFDLVLNATSTSTHGEPLALDDRIFRPGTLAYDMAYGPAARAFTERARSLGARASDGLGMLVEQAAESFALWRGKRPSTGPVLAELRAAQA